jgi:hypothetical protein
MTELLEQLLKDRNQSIEKAKKKIIELEQFLTDSGMRENFHISFSVQGSVRHAPIKSTVGKARDTQYIDFGWDLLGEEWCLYYSDQIGSYVRKHKLNSASNDYQVLFVERMGIFLERMGEWVLNSNELLDKGISQMENVICQ